MTDTILTGPPHSLYYYLLQGVGFPIYPDSTEARSDEQAQFEVSIDTRDNYAPRPLNRKERRAAQRAKRIL